MTTKIPAEPYDFPLNGGIGTDDTALLLIDFQVDFCGPGGYIDRLGVDLAPLRQAIEPARRVLETMRKADFLVAHTRETFTPDLSDVQPHRRYRGKEGNGIVVGDPSPLGRCLIRGEPCWDIVPELAPLPSEAIFDKHAYGAFGCTDIDAYLREHGISKLVITGLTTDCCIQSNVREALDRRYECVVLEDCCGATSRAAHEHSMTLLRNAAGVFGAVSDSGRLIGAVRSKRDAA